MSDQPFRGWGDEALAFYRGLEADNSKTYWTAHKHEFDEYVYAPMEALVSELEPQLGEARIMRPYRDIRFSKDKSPYRTGLGSRIGDGYVQISAAGLRAGSGYYHLAPDQLTRYREAVDRESSGIRLESVIAEVRRNDIEVSGADPLKTAPTRLLPRPCSDRTLALQGRDRVETLADRAVAGNRQGEGPGGRATRHHRAAHGLAEVRGWPVGRAAPPPFRLSQKRSIIGNPGSAETQLSRYRASPMSPVNSE